MSLLQPTNIDDPVYLAITEFDFIEKQKMCFNGEPTLLVHCLY